MPPLLPVVLAMIVATGQDVLVDRDDVQITRSCTISIGTRPIIDANANGVIHITGDDITVRFADDHVLRGSDATTQPDQMTGVGIVVRGNNITLENLNISGFKVGVHATHADGLTIDTAHFDNNFRQRLRSTPKREDVADWLSPHDNDDNQWLTRYGAAVCIEESTNVSISNVQVRRSQNGIILDTVGDSRIFDCDCSFLSGWGIAMWRSSENLICRNALDFCIRGYSDGIYNRGQDSAGLLMFEQCNNNVIAENSITHGGDGVFCFAGREALGEVNPRDDLGWYEGRGCSANLFKGNDLSYAAAHGLECTFSFDNTIIDNRFHENAICGIWGGYSQRTNIGSNSFARNGDLGYGLERGGINIEHGSENQIIANSFNSDKCGVHLWWDNDEALMRTPWFQVNHNANASAAVITRNSFMQTPTAIHLRDMQRAADIDHNTMEMVNEQDQLRVEGRDVVRELIDGSQMIPVPAAENYPGRLTPVGARDHLRGRRNIIMTQWGPWDHQSPLARRVDGDAVPGEHQWVLHGMRGPITIAHDDGVDVVVHDDGQNAPRLEVSAQKAGVLAYSINVVAANHTSSLKDVLVNAAWEVSVFNWTVDPREDVRAWRAQALGDHTTATMPALSLAYASGGPGDIIDAAADAGIGVDRFGTLATTSLRVPAGHWRLRTVSDDGIRVWIDDELVIDDWTWHAPREHTHAFTLAQPRAITLRVEHFELDGYAALSVDIESVERP